MAKRIRIFKSFEEHDAHSLDEMRRTTPAERFQRLFQLQKLNLKFHPSTKIERKFTIVTDGRSS